jgi:RimJ/RimL family protein N-acetyltransferase
VSDADFHVREATPDDAAGLIAHTRALLAEPDVCVTLSAAEFTVSDEDERRFIAGYVAADNSLLLVAEAAGEVIGLLTCTGGKRRAVRHEVELALSVRKAWRGRGVGTALIRRAIEWAKASGVVTRIELKVFTRNAPAARLYERLGFVPEGVRRRAVLRDGRYEDVMTMAILL